MSYPQIKVARDSLIVLATLLLANTSIADEAQEAANKAVGLRFINDFFNKQDFSVLPEIVAEDVIQHVTGLEDGRDAMEAALRGWFPENKDNYAAVKRVVADNDLVMIQTHNTRTVEDRGNDFAPDSTANLWIFRMENNQIAEFWEHEAPVLLETVNGNSAFDGSTFKETSAEEEEANILVALSYYDVINSQGLRRI